MRAQEMIDDLLKRGKIEPHEHAAIQLQMAGEKITIESKNKKQQTPSEKEVREIILDTDPRPYGWFIEKTQSYEFPAEGFYQYSGKLAKAICQLSAQKLSRELLSEALRLLAVKKQETGASGEEIVVATLAEFALIQIEKIPIPESNAEPPINEAVRLEVVAVEFGNWFYTEVIVAGRYDLSQRPMNELYKIYQTTKAK